MTRTVRDSPRTPGIHESFVDTVVLLWLPEKSHWLRRILPLMKREKKFQSKVKNLNRVKIEDSLTRNSFIQWLQIFIQIIQKLVKIVIFIWNSQKDIEIHGQEVV